MTCYSWLNLIKLAFSLNISEKYPNTTLHKVCPDSRVVPCGRTDREADTTKLIVAFRNFSKAPKIYVFLVRHYLTHTIPSFDVAHTVE